jgi:hypothetical protein
VFTDPLDEAYARPGGVARKHDVPDSRLIHFARQPVEQDPLARLQDRQHTATRYPHPLSGDESGKLIYDRHSSEELNQRAGLSCHG